MKIIRGKLGFDIPVAVENKNPKLTMTAEAMATWRGRLNLSDTGEAAKQIYLAINESNQTTMPPATRMQILEVFRNPLQHVCQSLRKHYIIEASILTKQKISIANLAQTLQLEMAYGYKAIIEDITQGKNDGKDILPNAVHLAMHYLTLVLFRSYQLYSAAPKNVWRELNLLYQFAEEKSLLKHDAGIETADKKITHSVLTTYKHALLLAATNPYQWRQNEQDVINNAIDKWAPFVTIAPYSKSMDEKPSIFIIHLDQDLPPNPLGLNEVTPTKNSIVLELKKEVAHLKEILEEMSKNEISARIAHEGDPEFEVAATTLSRLLKNWQVYITRKHKRYKVAGGMQIVFGLYAIHYYLNDEKSFDPKQQSSKKDNKDKKDSVASAIELPTFDAFGEDDDATATTNNAFSTSKTASKEFPIYKCTMVDVSPTGARVVVEDHSFPPIQAGEIITMRPEHSPEKTFWNIGVVRWLKHSANGNLHVGIQILAPQGTAAAAQILKDDVGSGYFLRCLLLPEMPDMNTQASIVTPTIPFKQGKDVLFYTDNPDNLTRASLTTEVDASGSYRQFEYLSQGQTTVKNNAAKKSSINTNSNADSNNFGIDISSASEIVSAAEKNAPPQLKTTDSTGNNSQDQKGKGSFSMDDL